MQNQQIFGDFQFLVKKNQHTVEWSVMQEEANTEQQANFTK